MGKEVKRRGFDTTKVFAGFMCSALERTEVAVRRSCFFPFYESSNESPRLRNLGVRGWGRSDSAAARPHDIQDY